MVRAWLLVAAVLAAFALAACGGDDGAQAGATTSGAAGAFPVTIDHASHGDDEGTERILEDAFDEEAEEDRGVYGEADEEDVSEDET